MNDRLCNKGHINDTKCTDPEYPYYRVVSGSGVCSAHNVCGDPRYPYYEAVRGYDVCYSRRSFAEGRGWQTCDDWCTTNVAVGDACNGCCGDMQNRLCHMQGAGANAAQTDWSTLLVGVVVAGLLCIFIVACTAYGWQPADSVREWRNSDDELLDAASGTVSSRSQSATE